MERTAILLSAAAFVATAPGTDALAQPPKSWVIENDHDYDFRVIVRPSDGNPESVLIKKNGGTGRFTIGKELHALTTVQITPTERRVIDHDPIDLREWTSDKDKTLMSEIVTPLKVGRTVVTRRDGSIIYEAMPDFPTNKRYDEFRKVLQRSAWAGKFGRANVDGVLQLNGKGGEAGYGRQLEDIRRDRTVLRSIKYSPGDSAFYITGEWLHYDQQGVMALRVDPETPWQAEGFYLRSRGQREDGIAWRLGSLNIPVVVVRQQTPIVDADSNVLRSLVQGDKLIVQRAAQDWCEVSKPDGSPVGWIGSDTIKVDR
jgi:hypothetical protein